MNTVRFAWGIYAALLVLIVVVSCTAQPIPV